MLEEIRLDDLGVIAHAVVPVGPGLTVLTGETGAGKTMVLSALGLLLGGRADSGAVRPGARRALVECRWRLPADHPALLRALDAGAELDDDGTLVVSRSVTAEGRSRCTVGGVGVPVALLAELGEHLVAVHGQADQQRLAQSSVQRDLVDTYAGDSIRPLLEAYRATYNQLLAARGELALLTEQAQARTLEADGLRHGVGLVGSLGPVPGEEEDAATTIARLSHAEALAGSTGHAHDLLVGGDSDNDGADVRSLAVTAARSVQNAAALDTSLAPLAERLQEIAVLASEAASELAAYADALQPDPAALQEAQERASALTALVRRYVPGEDAAALARWAENAALRLAELDGDDDRRTSVAGRVADLERRLTEDAAALSAARAIAAEHLTAQVGAELGALAMGAAVVTAEIAAATPGPSGADHLTLLLTPHPGAPARPLGRGASGGELSRIMLGLEVALAAADPVPTMVFDEVDAGVGGAAAVEVGRRLARLAADHQVLVVTHLAQVAAFADQHTRVVKDADGGVTSSDVAVLDDEQRAHELARMLGGLEDSASALDHARELRALAATR
jgi:DNA repair protein RecN (Recombination protein N)